MCPVGADALLTICLWKAGFAMTDPDPLYHDKQHSRMTFFDPDFQFPGPLPKAARLLKHLLHAKLGICSDTCQVGQEELAATAVHATKRLMGTR